MEALLPAVFLLSGLVALPAFAMSAYYSRTFNRYLRIAHPDIWTKIAPDPATEPSASAPDVLFITKRKYRAIGDPKLNALGDLCFQSGYWAASAFLVFVLSGVACATLKT